MNKLKYGLSVLLVSLMVFSMPFTAFAVEPLAEAETTVASESIDVVWTSTSDESENKGVFCFFDVETTEFSTELTLNEYSGNTQNFYAIAYGNGNEVTIHIRLLDSNQEVYGDWTITGNEYAMWPIENPPSGTWHLEATATGVGEEDSVYFFVRWQ